VGNGLEPRRETSARVVAALVGLFLTSAAIALAWLLYRLDRMHARHRDLDGALAVVRGVKRGMVERVDGDVGWAEHYFATVYTGDPGDPELDKRLEEAWASVVERRSPMQVFPVPLAPLQLLVSSPDLVSDETVFIANVALWRIGVFNQYVRIQEDFNARLAPEIHDPHLDEDRRKAIGHAAGLDRGADARLRHRQSQRRGCLVRPSETCARRGHCAADG
jgi:hypothetical protein